MSWFWLRKIWSPYLSVLLKCYFSLGKYDTQWWYEWCALRTQWSIWPRDTTGNGNIGKLRHGFVAKFWGTHALNHKSSFLRGAWTHHDVIVWSRKPCFCELFAVSKKIRHQVAVWPTHTVSFCHLMDFMVNWPMDKINDVICQCSVNKYQKFKFGLPPSIKIE